MIGDGLNEDDMILMMFCYVLSWMIRSRGAAEFARRSGAAVYRDVHKKPRQYLSPSVVTSGISCLSSPKSC